MEIYKKLELKFKLVPILEKMLMDIKPSFQLHEYYVSHTAYGIERIRMTTTDGWTVRVTADELHKYLLKVQGWSEATDVQVLSVKYHERMDPEQITLHVRIEHENVDAAASNDVSETPAW